MYQQTIQRFSGSAKKLYASFTFDTYSILLRKNNLITIAPLNKSTSTPKEGVIELFLRKMV